MREALYASDFRLSISPKHSTLSFSSSLNLHQPLPHIPHGLPDIPKLPPNLPENLHYIFRIKPRFHGIILGVFLLHPPLQPLHLVLSQDVRKLPVAHRTPDHEPFILRPRRLIQRERKQVCEVAHVDVARERGRRNDFVAVGGVGRVEEGVELRGGPVDAGHAGDGLERGAEDDGRVEDGDGEGRVVLVDEGPDGFFREGFGDAV